MSHYHEIADKTMDCLLESLEELYEIESLVGYEVEFHVRDHQSHNKAVNLRILYRVESSHSTWVLTELMS